MFVRVRAEVATVFPTTMPRFPAFCPVITPKYMERFSRTEQLFELFATSGEKTEF